MRTSILAVALLGLTTVACTGVIEDGGGGGGGDDVQGGPSCGDGVVDSGESCDDGNDISGDGCSASCATEAVPRLAINVDKPAVTTDLLVPNTIEVGLTAFEGFAGNVTLAATVVDANGAPIAGWTSSLSTTTVTLAANASGTATLTLMVPGDSAALAGTVKITATSSVAAQEAAVAVTANPTVVIAYATTGQNCVYPTAYPISNPIRMKVNRKLRIMNTSSNLQMQIHMDGGISGVSHQGSPMAAGAAYEQTPTSNSDGANVTFYCHNANQPGVVAVEAGGQTTLRQRLVVVD